MAARGALKLVFRGVESAAIEAWQGRSWEPVGKAGHQAGGTAAAPAAPTGSSKPHNVGLALLHPIHQVWGRVCGVQHLHCSVYRAGDHDQRDHDLRCQHLEGIWAIVGPHTFTRVFRMGERTHESLSRGRMAPKMGKKGGGQMAELFTSLVPPPPQFCQQAIRISWLS